MSEKAQRDPELEEELKSVKNLLKNFDRAEKGLSLYPPHSEILKGFLDELVQSFERHLENYPVLEFTISSTTLTCRGEVVYENHDRNKSMAFRLFQSGLRKLAFQSGLEREEILTFLDILKRGQSLENTDDDVVTLLWEEDCPHINYMTIDFFSDEESQRARKVVEKMRNPKEVTSRIVRMVSTEALEDAKQKTDLEEMEDEEKIEEDLYSLKEDELAELKEKLTWEKDFNPLYDFSSVIFQILKEEENIKEFQDLLDVVGEVIRVSVAKDLFEDALPILQQLKQLPQHILRPNPAKEKLILEQIQAISDAQLVREVGIYLKKHANNEQKFTEICHFLQQLHPKALLHICNLLKDVPPLPPLLQVIDLFSQKDINLLLTKLYDNNVKIVRGILKVLGQKQDPRIAKEVLPLLDHREPTVRLEAAETLAQFDNPLIQKTFLEKLDRFEPQLKNKVFHYLIRTPNPSIYSQLLQLVEDKNFLERPFVEKKSILIALAVSNPDQATPLLMEKLRTKAWLRKKQQVNQIRQAAALALGYTKKMDVIHFLEKYRNDSDPDVADACITAINQIISKRK
ncbi:MAG: HEAT repeat domain-containing protein [Planctomycetota bacterium]|nr:MAG: HEAT repeat domain-containing protein [Planctomycetota bacterium]